VIRPLLPLADATTTVAVFTGVLAAATFVLAIVT
jgi:hypothetical protein